MGTPPPALTPEQLVDLLALLEGADSVELKLSVPDPHRRSTVAALGMDPLEAQPRQVVFFDTPDLALNRQGVVLRARRIQRKQADSIVKLRPIDPRTLPEDLRTDRRFSVEVDAQPGGFVCSGTLKDDEVADAHVREVLAGDRAISKLFTKRQRALVASSTDGLVQVDDLSVLGPINVAKLKWTPEDLGRRMVAELWFYPDGSRILELSTKCAPAEAFTVAAETKAFLGSHGVDLGAEQQTKTRSALQFFAGELAGS